MSGRNTTGRFYHKIDCTNLFDEEQSTLPEFEPFSEAEATPRGVPGSPLSVVDVDLCKSMNSGPHKTWMYTTQSLVVRRGDPFLLKITFNRLITEQDYFQLQFRIGSNPTALRTSLVSLSFTGFSSSGPWEARAQNQEGALLVEVTPAPDAVVGRYRVVVGVAMANGLQFTPEFKYQLYLLFNAWNPKDEAYLENQSDCGEYVLNDSGIIYMGDADAMSERPWTYGQFEEGVLDACIYVMDMSQLPISSRGDAIKVVRMASAMINSQDDNGVLLGNWSNDFSMGVAPTLWTGSPSILLQYATTRVPVGYAQCWVYAGVLNTFLRCLGFASRVITNFCSAHDNNGNLRTDLIFTEDLQPDTRNTRDSIWNYHCWNEVFLKRTDIPQEFSGWQVVDATPQETSDGYYRCGPASVKSIKIGKVCFPFDGRFIFAEVNSDVVYHKRDKYGNLTQFQVNRKMIGKKLVTKSPLGNTPLEITSEYKFDEDLEEDKNQAAMATAESFGCERDHTEIEPNPLKISINTEKVYFSLPVEAQVDFVNQSGSLLKTQVLMSVEAIYYTGVPSHLVHRENYSLDLHPNNTQKMALSVPPQDYMNFLGYQPSLQITVTAKTDQGQTVSESKVLSVEVLQLSMKVSSPVYLRQKASVVVSYTNNLTVPMIKPRLVIEGAGLMSLRIKDFETLEPGAQIKTDMDFYPYLLGPRSLNAAMICTNLYMALGSVQVNVQDAPYWMSPGNAPFGSPLLSGFRGGP